VSFLGIIVMGIFGAVLLSRNPNSDFGRLCVNLLLFQLFSILLTLPHELGHAFSARWMGFVVHRIWIGFGTTIFCGRIFGFNIDLKTIPTGGLCIAAIQGEKSLRLKQWIYIFAGPMANFILGVGAFFLFSSQSFAGFMPGSQVHLSVADLFVLTNVVILLINLFPVTYVTPFGDFASDGLALLRLCFPGISRAAAEPKPPGRLINFILEIFRWIGISLMAGLSLCCFIAGFPLILPLWARGGKVFSMLPAMLLLYLLGAMCAWVAYRFFKAPSTPIKQGAASQAPHAQVVADFQKDLLSQLPSVEHTEFIKLRAIISTAMSDKNTLPEAENLHNNTLEKEPGNLLLLFWKGDVLLRMDRNAEAGKVFEDILRNNKLCPASQVTIMVARLKAIVRLGDYERARILCVEFLAGAFQIHEKVYLLDVLSCLPIMEGITSYLPEAVKWCDQALQLQPENITLKGTQGSLLVEQGKTLEAEPLLREVFDKSEDDTNKGISAFYLAMCAKQSGDMPRALKWAKRAKKLYREQWILTRLQAEFAV
jgi:tetratricopeptide (TPR) repeat protein